MIVEEEVGQEDIQLDIDTFIHALRQVFEHWRGAWNKSLTHPCKPPTCKMTAADSMQMGKLYKKTLENVEYKRNRSISPVKKRRTYDSSDSDDDCSIMAMARLDKIQMMRINGGKAYLDFLKDQLTRYFALHRKLHVSEISVKDRRHDENMVVSDFAFTRRPSNELF